MSESSESIQGTSRILIVDDFGPWRAVAGAIIRGEPGFRVIAEAVDGFEAVERTSALSPDIILMDIAMPGMNGIEAAGRIREVSPGCKILFFSELRSLDIAERALHVGGSGYILKSDTESELIPALKAVLAGERFISPRIVEADLLAKTGFSDDAHRAGTNPFVDLRGSAAIHEFLTSVIQTTKADFGNVRLFDSANSLLKIAAHSGFPNEFVKCFGSIDSAYGCACARAMRTRLRVIVTEVSSDPLFSTEARTGLVQAKIRSLQSTPLIGSGERFIGVVSTHYSRPGGPLPEVLPRLDDLAAHFLAVVCS